ncbi:MAG: hypothetical protein HYT20_02755 [Candidatus Nealsonbacteria bacterium]|nr:hypothetical protein [Candidatus Nealsonbacteria bacterium]
MKKEKLLQFLLKARMKTYAGADGKVQPAFGGSDQLEYREGDLFYRDLYYTGNGIFMGVEVVHYQDKPIWAMSYYGNFKGMTEEEIDKILREALVDNWQDTRIWKKVEWEKDNYKYICEPNFEGSIDELAGIEKLFKRGEEVYRFFYGGGLIGQITQ